MEEIKIRKEDEYIKLGQLLKKAGIVSLGTEAKFVIEEGLVSVNGQQELRRGRKIKEGDIVTGDDWALKVIK